MSAERIHLHPENPQSRLIGHIIAELMQGSVLVLPTDSGYSFACAMDQKEAMAQIIRIRELDKHHLFSLLCPDIQSIANCAYISNHNFRLLKSPYPRPIYFCARG